MSAMSCISLLSSHRYNYKKSIPLFKFSTKHNNTRFAFFSPSFTPISQTLNPHFYNSYPLYSIENENEYEYEHEQNIDLSTKPFKLGLWVLFWASVCVAWFAASGDANSAVDSIRASGLGVRVAKKLRGLGWSDDCVVFVMAMLPVVELRGAIPVGYWFQLTPLRLTILSLLGNMVPVPFILLYLKKLAIFLAKKHQYGSHMLDLLFKRAKEKAGPVEEFQWLGLMLFVAVPFPGTGAWTGAIVASVLDMPFWHATSANFCGVVLAGLLVNLLVNLGMKYAIVTGVGLFIFSTFMWSILRNVKKSFS